MIGAAGAALLSGVAAIAQGPPEDPRFARILYLHGGPTRDAALWKSVRDLGFDAVSLRGVDERVEGLTRAGLRFYRDQIVGKGVLELRDADWFPLHARYDETREHGALVRPTCMSEADVVTRLTETIARELEALGGRDPIGVTLADEPSSTRRISPLDFCRGRACVAAFREFLRQRYRTVDALGVAWGTHVASWDAVEPWTADRIRARELRAGLLPENLTPWADHLEFRDRVFVGLAAKLAKQVRALASVPVGMTGMQAPSAYGGYDYVALMPSQTFYEVYDIGGARALARSFAPGGALEVATLFPIRADAPERIVESRLFDLVAHGLSGVIVWSAGEVFEGREPSRFGRAVRRAFAALEPLAERAAGARVIHSPIWLVESQASVRAHWMLDSAGDGKTWPRRLGSYESTHSTSQAARASWLRLLEDLGHQPRFVPAAGLRAALATEQPSLVVLPAVLALSDDAVLGIAEFVRKGGHVVADHGAGIYDERLKLRSRPPLDEVFGLAERAPRWPRVLEGRGDDGLRIGSGVAIAEPEVRASIAEPVGEGRVAHCEHRFERGRAVYLNLALCEYERVRLDPDRVVAARDLRARVRRVLADAGAAPLAAVRARGLPACLEVVPLEAPIGPRLLAVRVNALASEALLAELGEAGPKPVVVEFPREVRVRNVASGRDLGVGRRFECELDPYAGLLFEVEDVR